MVQLNIDHSVNIVDKSRYGGKEESTELPKNYLLTK